MVSSTAVRDTGDTILYLLRSSVPPLVPTNDIVLAVPADFERTLARPKITVFLYRVGVNAEVLNRPPRSTDGKMTRPPLPLELHYMITPWARETRDEAEIAGRVLQVLSDHPVIGAPDLQGSSWEPDDAIQLAFETLPLDDQFRIWDTAEIPYRLSLTYVARVVGVQTPIIDARIG